MIVIYKKASDFYYGVFCTIQRDFALLRLLRVSWIIREYRTSPREHLTTPINRTILNGVYCTFKISRLVW